MTENNDILNKLKKRDKPSLNEGYFTNFQDDIMMSIDNDSLIDQLKTRTKPDVPEGYFEGFSDSVLNNITPKKGKLIQLFYRVSIAAACFAIIFGAIYLNSNNTELKELSLTENEEVLLTYLSEDDIIDYIESDEKVEEDTELLEDYLFEELEGDVYEYYNEMNL